MTEAAADTRDGDRRRRRDPGAPGADLGLRQDRRRRLRQGPGRARGRDPLHRRHRRRPARGRPRGDRRLRVHRPGGDPRRPGEDAAPAAARGAAGPARRPRAHGDAGARGDRADRPGLRQPLPLRADRRRARRRARGGDREHRHRRADDDPRRRQEPRGRRRRRQARVLRRGLRRAGGVRRRDLRLDPALARQRGLRPDRPLRRRDQPLVLDRVRGLPGTPGGRLREGARPLLRREPAPARRALRRGRRAQPRPLAGLEAARQGALLQQRARPRLGPRPGRRLRASRPA